MSLAVPTIDHCAISCDLLRHGIAVLVEKPIARTLAEADKLIAQAHAESRRAAAVAVEQEMRARVQEMRARVVEAEAQVPLAMAQALRDGHIGVLDYYNLRNVVADTEMRSSIGKTVGSDPQSGGPPPCAPR